MPNIREAPARDLEIRPTETGIDATQRAARTIGQLYHQGSQDLNAAGDLTAATGQRYAGAIKSAGDVAVKQVEHHEITTGSANFSQMQANLAEQWNETAKKADPNDPTVAAKFREQVLEPALDKFGNQGFLTEGGQKWAQGHTAALRQHMYEKTSADMSTLAGEAVKENYAKTVNNLASSARLDPSSLDFSLKTAESSIGGIVDSSPTLSPADAGRVKTEGLQKAKEAIIKSAVFGMIERNPNVDLAKVEKKYGEYISGPEMQALQKAAQVQQRKDTLLERQTQLIKKQQDDLAVHAGANKNMSDNVRIDPNTHRPIINPKFFDDALDLTKKYPDAPSAATVARTQMDWGEHKQDLKDQSPRTDPAVKQDLVDRMFSTDKPTTEVELMRAQINGKLNNNDFAALHGLVKALEERPLKGPIWHDTMDAVKSELIVNVPGIPGKDITGSANYAKFAQTFIPQYLAKERAGTLEPNALDVKDPNSMISKAMAPFKRTMSQRMNDYMTITNASGQGEKVLGIEVKNAPPAPLVRSKAEYDGLKSGAKFIDETGKQWSKP